MKNSRNNNLINAFSLPIEGGFNNRERTPSNMTLSDYPDMESRRAMQKIAMNIFVDCTNTGWSLCDSIESVFMSGLHMGLEGGVKLQEKESLASKGRPTLHNWLT